MSLFLGWFLGCVILIGATTLIVQNAYARRLHRQYGELYSRSAIFRLLGQYRYMSLETMERMDAGFRRDLDRFGQKLMSLQYAVLVLMILGFFAFGIGA